MTNMLAPASSIDVDSGEPVADKSTDQAKHVVNLAVEPGDAKGEPYDVKAVAPIATPHLVDASEQVGGSAGPGVVYGFQVLAGTGTITLDLYDNTSATGDPIFKGKAAGYTIGDVVTFPCAMEFTTGLWAVVGGTTPKFRVLAAMAAP